MGLGKKKSPAPAAPAPAAPQVTQNEAVPDDESRVQERRSEPVAAKSLLDPSAGQQQQKKQGMLG